MNKKLLGFLLAISLTHADTSLQSPLFNFFAALQWEKFWDEFRITGTLHTCEVKSMKDGLIGFQASMIEPIGIIEVSPQKGYSLSLEMDVFDYSMLEDGNTRNKKGSNVHVHFIKFPILAQVFEESMGGIICLDNSGMSIPYISELMMAHNPFTNLKLFATEALMHNPVAMMAGLVDCAATEAAAQISDKLSSSWIAVSRVRAGMYWNNGCSSTTPPTCSGRGKDPIEDGAMQAFRALSVGHKLGFLLKTSEFGVQPETWCGSTMFPSMPSPQYMLQLAYPTVGEAFEIGQSPTVYTTLKQRVESKDQTAFYVWRRRNYAALAINCGN